jgi:endonuclease/exonuclease/phosphatase family metal-dependent hydrolase
MNATPIWPTYRRLRRHLSDGVADWAERVGARPAPTWAKSPGWPPVLRIDHVFTSGVELAQVLVEPIAGLDHRAVVADMSWPEQ